MNMWLENLGKQGKKLIYSTHTQFPWPFSKKKINLKSDRVNLVAPASPIECLLSLPNVRRYSTNWDRKGWPGSEIQIYYGCPSISKLLR